MNPAPFESRLWRTSLTAWAVLITAAICITALTTRPRG